MGLPEQPEVLDGFAKGELDAFELLFRQFQNEVYAWIVCIVRDPPAAEELTVETFWRAYRAHARFDPSRSFGAWTRRIATNVALDHVKSTREKVNRSAVPMEAVFVENLSSLAAPDPGVQREIRDRTRSALRQLPTKLQVVAMLALVEERPHHEIAEALGISTAAVKARLFRAVRLLRAKLRNLKANYE